MASVTVVGGWAIDKGNAQAKRELTWSAIHVEDTGIGPKTAQPRRAKGKAESWAKERARMV